MKKLQFTEAFGNFEPGDVIEVEDDAAYDTAYLREAPEGAETPKKSKKPAEAPRAPLYPKRD